MSVASTFYMSVVSTFYMSVASTSVPPTDDRLPTVPPCRVCGGKGDGFHYGVNTCRSCKVS